MKTFIEFVNEDQHFLRSISKNDKVVDAEKPLTELREGDWFWYCEHHLAWHCQIKEKSINLNMYSKDPEYMFEINDDWATTLGYDSDNVVDDYTAHMTLDGGPCIITTNYNAFLEFKEDVCPNVEIEEYPI